MQGCGVLLEGMWLGGDLSDGNRPFCVGRSRSGFW